MGVIIALGLCFVGFTIMTAVALYKDSELDDMKARYKTSIEFSDAMQEARDAAEERLLLANADIEMLKLDIAHYQRVIAEMEAQQEQEEKAEEQEPPPLFDGKHTNVFRCEGYRKITDTTSDHYAFQQECYTDENGIRAYNTDWEKFYCVALAGHFGWNIGDAWIVELANGNIFNVILSDYKRPIPKSEEEWKASETDYGKEDFSYLSPKNESGEYIKDSLCVLEFLVEKEKVPEKTWQAGTLTQLPEFGGLNSYDGDIVRMVYIGREWEGRYDINGQRESEEIK